MAASQTAGREPPKVAIVGESDHIVAETAARILAEFADPQTINRAKDGAWRGPLWRAVSDAGLPLAWVPEQLGGSGASLADGFAVLGAADVSPWRCRLPRRCWPVGCSRAPDWRRRMAP